MTTQKRDPEHLKNGHDCDLDSDWDVYGPAIEYCTEDVEGKLWSGNGEYQSQVNFCPGCGFQARTQIEET